MPRFNAVKWFALAMLLLATALVCAISTAPANAAAAAGNALTQKHEKVTDSLGETFVPRDFQRMVTLAPNLTETVHFLGEFDRIVGVTSYDNYPPEVTELPEVGGYVNPSVEKIVALKPDLVLAFRGNPLPVINKLKELGITVFVLDNPSSLREILEQMEKVAQLIEAPDSARDKIDALRKGLDLREKAIKALPRRPRVLMLACCLAPPFYAAGRGTFIDDLIRLAGGENTFKGKGFAVASAEDIVVADPQYLLLPAPPGDAKYRQEVLAKLRQYSYLAQTTAVKKGRIILIDEDILTRPGPRIFHALEILARELKGVGV